MRLNSASGGLQWQSRDVRCSSDRQQQAVGRALPAVPKVMLLDEPTEGIQPNIVEGIEPTITWLNKQHGITTMLVEQDIG